MFSVFIEEWPFGLCPIICKGIRFVLRVGLRL